MWKTVAITVVCSTISAGVAWKIASRVADDVRQEQHDVLSALQNQMRDIREHVDQLDGRDVSTQNWIDRITKEIGLLKSR